MATHNPATTGRPRWHARLQFGLQFTTVPCRPGRTGQRRWSSLNRSGPPRAELLMRLASPPAIQSVARTVPHTVADQASSVMTTSDQGPPGRQKTARTGRECKATIHSQSTSGGRTGALVGKAPSSMAV
jgi:hypothetical protein